MSNYVGAECRLVVHVDSSWLYYEALRASAELKHSLFSVIFTAIFIPKNKIHRKYVHLFRPKNKTPKNKKNAFFGAENEKENEIRSATSLRSGWSNGEPLVQGKLGACADALNVITSDRRTVQQTTATDGRHDWLATTHLSHPVHANHTTTTLNVSTHGSYYFAEINFHDFSMTFPDQINAFPWLLLYMQCPKKQKSRCTNI